MRYDVHEIRYLRVYFFLRKNRIADMLIRFHDGADVEFGFASSLDFQRIYIWQYLFQSIYGTQIF